MASCSGSSTKVVFLLFTIAYTRATQRAIRSCLQSLRALHEPGNRPLDEIPRYRSNTQREARRRNCTIRYSLNSTCSRTWKIFFFVSHQAKYKPRAVSRNNTTTDSATSHPSFRNFTIVVFYRRYCSSRSTAE
ncbi:hypothetical protein VTL71DRAFT_13954 [Oculimacula yallundae]|uniref:Secreted protein n=1 Tax=Oculimacula yallundae TaxID=86028 RepID=A0ABR4CNN8_9HELO